MPTSRLTLSGDIGGISVNSTVTRTADGQIGHDVTLNPAKTGTLSTRTSDTEGTLTLESGHGIQTGDMYTASWNTSGTDAAVYDVDFEAWDLAGNSQLAEDAETICPEEPTPGDLNADGCVDQADLGILLTERGCTDGECPADCDDDGDTDQSDVGILLTQWREGCPWSGNPGRPSP
ncbi:MAG: hypothetical protein KAY37_04790 [Phycisphaerae bacterium]|nr:hypothetical protein [Phycisphaerae bacterium]